ncbi:hypothetical protein [Halosolutus gelatinilyticus]|uniref:hypothetical protein n=1 Tax=Halosolutus gelatinilyticus TaxID=2931975 RepID=UPI0031F2EA92
MGSRANPAFAAGVIVIPIAALAYAIRFGTVQQHTYVHVTAGVLWTGIDLFMALVLGPVLGGLDVSERASVFERFTPKMTFLMPALALVTIAGGITLAIRLGIFPHADPWIALFSTCSVLPALLLLGWQLKAVRDRRWQAAFAIALVAHAAFLAVTLPAFETTTPSIAVSLAIVIVLTVLGFGVLLPGEARIYLEMVSADPDPNVISRYGMRNAKLSGVQGAFQLAIVVVMVYIRWGWI